MGVAAKVQSFDRHVSAKTFALSFAATLICSAAAIAVTGIMGELPEKIVSTSVSIPTVSTVTVKSGDLNQIDLNSKPPAQENKSATDAGKPEALSDVKPVIAGLIETTPQGNVPAIRDSDGLTPFKAYSAPFTADPNAKGRISFLVADFGLSAKNSLPLITDLPSGFSFLISPYLVDAQKWTDSARKYAHEIWLDIPMQSPEYPAVDTGPNSQLLNLSDTESNTRLLKTLASITGYAGVTIDNLFTFEQNKDKLQKIVTSVAVRGLGILQPDPKKIFDLRFISDQKAPAGGAAFALDVPVSEKDIQAKLIEIETLAAQKKNIIVILRPYPVTIKTIKAWIPQAQSRGIQLAPVSAVLAPAK
jgi:hypothetical protein